MDSRPLRAAARIKNRKKKLNLEKVYQVRIHRIANFRTLSLSLAKGRCRGSGMNEWTKERTKKEDAREVARKKNEITAFALSFRRIVVNCGTSCGTSISRIFLRIVWHTFRMFRTLTVFRTFDDTDTPSDRQYHLDKNTRAQLFRIKLFETSRGSAIFFCMPIFLSISQSDKMFN